MTISTNWTEGRPQVVLLATDRSARCDRPLDRAVQLAHSWDAQLVVLHVVEKLRKGEDAASVAADLKARLLEEVPTRQAPFRVEVRFGSVPETVLATATDVGADLIVTGVARYNEVGDYILGTTVDLLVRKSPIPVLVVKRRASQDYARILAASDYSDCSAQALEVLPAFPNAEAVVIHAYHVPFEGFIDTDANAAEFRDHYAAESAAFRARLSQPNASNLTIEDRYGETCSVLARAVRDEEFELAVIATHGRTGLGRALIGSTAEALLGCLPCDVLVVPARR
jgi:nucleotide-binding universal stress UspA family protein